MIWTYYMLNNEIWEWRSCEINHTHKLAPWKWSLSHRFCFRTQIFCWISSGDNTRPVFNIARLIFTSVFGFVDGFGAWGHEHRVWFDNICVKHSHSLWREGEARVLSWFFLLFILNMHDLCFNFLHVASRSPAVNSIAWSLSSPSSGTVDSSGARSSAGESGYEIKGKLAIRVYHRNKKKTQVIYTGPGQRVELNKHTVMRNCKINLKSEL